MTTKLGRMVAHLNGLLSIKLHDTLITWSCDFMWKAKTIISPLPQPVSTNLGRMVTYLEGLLSKKSHNILVTSSGKVTWQAKIIISLLPECLWYQAWQNGSSPWWAATPKVSWLFDHVILRDHVTSLDHYISTITMPMVTKIYRMVTYLEELLTIIIIAVIIVYLFNVNKM